MNSLCGGNNNAANMRLICFVCLDDYDLGGIIIVLPCVGCHKFQEECLKIWLHKRSKYQLCQDNVRVRIGYECHC